MRYYFYYLMPIVGEITILSTEMEIEGIYFSHLKDCDAVKCEVGIIREAYVQLMEYLEGKRTFFTLPFSIKGTDFQKKVWLELLNIPYGSTASYKEIAERIGSPKACRAVGMANNKNPVSIVIPCHRVIGSNGDLVGYGGGLDRKKKLLELEKIRCESKRTKDELLFFK